MKKDLKPKKGRPLKSPDAKVDSRRFSVVVPVKLAVRIEQAASDNGISRNAQIVEWLGQIADAPVIDNLNHTTPEPEVQGICDMIGCSHQGASTKKPVGMWIRYDDSSIEYSPYKTSEQSALARKFSEVREYLGTRLPGQFDDTKRKAAHTTGTIFDTLLHRRKTRDL